MDLNNEPLLAMISFDLEPQFPHRLRRLMKVPYMTVLTEK